MEELGGRISTDNIASTDAAIEIKEPSEIDFYQSEHDSVDLSPRNGSPERQMLKLMRHDESLFDQDESGYGDLFQKGMMLSLTIVMCMVLCLTGFSISEYYYSTSIEL